MAAEWLGRVITGSVSVGDLLCDHVVRDLHRQLYAPVWAWGGRQRALETNIGTPPEGIAVGMRNALDDLRYQWESHAGLSARTLGIAAYAAVVRVHPFVDGNGRVTRLLADLLFVAAQPEAESLLAYDWDVDRHTYIRLLGDYDRTRDPTALVAFIPVFRLDGLLAE